MKAPMTVILALFILCNSTSQCYGNTDQIFVDKCIISVYAAIDAVEADEVADDWNDMYLDPIYTSSEFQYLGEVYYDGWRWTWYSENVLPGGGLDIPGRYVDENLFVCDGDGYICLASSTLPYGTVLETPFGKYGKVYDSGCDEGTVDVYVSF